MEQTTEDTDRRGKTEISRTITIILVALYMVVGLMIGWVFTAKPWKPRPFPNDPIEEYAAWYYQHQSNTFLNTYWRGIRIDKCPLDAWVYQELIYEIKPDVLVETGTFMGGSALFYATMFDLLNQGRVVTVDIVDYHGKPQHPRIKYLLGSSTSDEIFRQIKESIQPGEKVMVSLDSDHHKAHVLKELELYHNLVTVGSYLVVEDTRPDPNYPAARDALEQFLKTNTDFVPDKSREKFGFTVFPDGWLKRIR
jgi:cephalosporin hydroxylase